MNSKTIIFCNLETNSLDHGTGSIKLISTIKNDGTVNVSEAVSNELSCILQSVDVRKVFYNAPFNVSLLQSKGYSVNNYDCTSLMAQVLGESSLSYEALCNKYLNISIDKSMQNSDNWQGDTYSSEHLEYAKKDVEYIRELYFKLRGKLLKDGLLEVYERERRALVAIVMLKNNGIKMEFNQWNEVLDEDRNLSYRIEAEIRGLLKNDNLNLNSPKQLIEVINQIYGIKLSSTSDDELAKYSDTNLAIQLIRKHQKLCTHIKTYGQKLATFINEDGRIRADWRLIGATSGRMACSNPPLQGMPCKSRKFFVAEQGNTLVCADYSQIELRVLAEISQDLHLMNYFDIGVDLHTGTASLLFQKPLDTVTQEERQIAKSINFGIVYGITAYGIQRNLVKIGLDVSLDEAEQYRQSFLKAYPKVHNLQDMLLRADEIRTLGGRMWKSKHLTMTQRMNLPIQGSAAEGLKESLGLLVNQLNPTWKLVSVVHDEIVLETPKSEGQIAKQVLESCMIEGMKKLVKQVPIQVETKISKHWCK